MPNTAALKSAARAAIVMPAVFAFADRVIAQPQTSIFAAFGSFAILVLVEFGDPPRALVLLWASRHLDNLWRLEAHLGERANAARASATNEGALRMLHSWARGT